MYIAVTTVGRTLVGHYTVIVVFNDGFVQTSQQAYSIAVTLFISYMWAVISVLMFANTDTCECDSR